MNSGKTMAFRLVFATLNVCLLVKAQNALAPELGRIQGVVTRANSTDPLPNVSVTLEGGIVEPQVMQQLLATAAGVGVTVTPPPGVSLSEITQLMTDTVAARGLPVGADAIQNAVNRIVAANKWPTVTTGSDGRFVFRDLRLAKYTVRARLDGYFGKPFNGAYPTSGSMEVDVSGKDPVTESMPLIQGGTIGGRVTDASGQTLGNASVQAFTTSYLNGAVLLQQALTKATDDHGEYRLFWLPPGDYYIGAASRGGAKTFYPGTSRIAAASMVHLASGVDLRGVDLGVRAGSAFTISGQVRSLISPAVGVTASPNPAAALELVSNDLNIPDDASRVVTGIRLLLETGMFDLRDVPPGSYDLFARIRDPNVQSLLQGFAWGRAPIEVRDGNIENVSLEMKPTVEMRGTIRVDGVGPLPSNLRIVLQVDGAASRIPLYQLVATRAAPVGQDVGFAVSYVPPGRFRIGAVTGLPSGFYIADVRQDAKSVFDSGFEVESQTVHPIEIVIAVGAGVIEGVIQDGPEKPFSKATVALIPDSSRLQNRALYQSTITDEKGRYTLRGVAPGNYKLYAWESIPQNAYQNTGFLAKYDGRGQDIHVIPNARLEIPGRAPN